MKKIILACICSALPLLASTQSIAATESDFNTALGEASSLKVNVAEHYASSGQYPGTLEDIGISTSDLNFSQIENISFNQNNGAMLFNLSSTFGEKQWLSYIPEVDYNGHFNFTCKTTLGDDIAGNSICDTNVPYDALDVVVDSNLFRSTLIAAISTRVSFAEHYASTGEILTSMDELGIDSTFLKSANVNNVIVEPESGTILFGLSPIYGANEWLTLIPNIYPSGYIGWSCETTLPDAIKGVYCGDSLEVDDLLN